MNQMKNKNGIYIIGVDHGYGNIKTAKDYRGTCPTRHYVRADSLEQVLLLEFRRMSKLLVSDEETFAEFLAQKTGQLHRQE